MPEEQADIESETTAEQPVLDSGTYEIIRRRLTGQADVLLQRLNQLNEERKKVFGSVETTLLRSLRITTEHNCIPRDIVRIGKNHLVFGYNVHFGLKTEITLGDVFGIYDYGDNGFHPISTDLLLKGRFEEDFKSLYKYYKNTAFVKFSVIGPHLFMVFRVGKSESDVKTFKWVLKEDELVYIDNRSDHEYRFPSQYEFDWKRTYRDHHRSGKHPHISIEDRVFVECIGGTLTIKVEDNTETGNGIYSEKVDHIDQTLDDAEVSYACLDNLILLKIRPFQEKATRFFLYNEKLNEVHRIDSLSRSCVRLPGDQGIIFPDGYYLQTGELKQFDTDLSDMLFERQVVSPNGEDTLYVFYNRLRGDYILLSYNVISQSVETPIHGHGFVLFENGILGFFKTENEPQKHHAVQIWQTPYVDSDFEISRENDSFLYQVGNRDIVRCMSECHEIYNLLRREDSYSGLYIDLVKRCADVMDSYFWIDKPESFQIKDVLESARETAGKAIDEFQKVQRLKKETAEKSRQVEDRVKEIIQNIQKESLNHIDPFVNNLTSLRSIRGQIISLKNLRYIDLEKVTELDQEVSEKTSELSTRCVEFLLNPESLEPYRLRIEKEAEQIEGLKKVTDAESVQEEITAFAEELEMLIEIVSNLKIEDSTQTTQIIDGISAIFSTLNQVKTALKKKTRSLFSVEGKAQFNAQLKLLNQSVINYLDVCETPEKCEEYLNKVMVQLEELEGRFADLDEFTVQLSEKRTEIYEAFEARKLNLIEQRNKKADSLMTASERILKVIQHRAEGMKTVNDINGYFASDLMIERIRDIVKRLLGLDDSVKADDLEGRIKTIQQDAVRRLKDRLDLYVEGTNIIRFGQHNFSVNIQPLDLTTVLRGDTLFLHMTGTKFFLPMEDEALIATRPVWSQQLPSENDTVYRAEYLACLMLEQAECEGKDQLKVLSESTDKALAEKVREFMGPRFTESYTKGIHDHDATLILKTLLKMHTSLGLARYRPAARACANLFWLVFIPTDQKQLWHGRLKSCGSRKTVFPGAAQQDDTIKRLNLLVLEFIQTKKLFPEQISMEAAEYLFEELTVGDAFSISQEAAEIWKDFHQHLKDSSSLTALEKARASVRVSPETDYEVVRDWVNGFIRHSKSKNAKWFLEETAALIFTDTYHETAVVKSGVLESISDMKGDHPVVQENRYELNYLEFNSKLREFRQTTLPAFETYQERKRVLLEEAGNRLRLEEFQPKVLTSFVRNQLIDQVFLPMIGDNLAKQIGTTGGTKRTDLMGLLLLVSPPGYGKTTLMEYLANRLGLIFVKINGPALGHNVVSLDPSEPSNASAKQEVEKLNLSLEMGDNIMIYLDDIQHCNPEFLQKFISLCDGQRRIEGVFNGHARTYDLRGRKVVVVMAVNPYTESGEKFRIPDMLANRADTYNLGDIIGGHAAAFKSSYLENAITSNRVLQKLSHQSQKDVQSFIGIAESGSREGVDFEANYSVEEMNEIVSVLEKMIRVRDVILQVNLEYIHSAAQAEEYRTEPAFKLQGSYRNMNRLAEKVMPIMNDEEITALLMDHYSNESQTLTTGAESNLLRFKEMIGIQSDEEKNRWNDIKKTFQRNLVMGQGDPSDPIGRVVNQLSVFGDGLDGIESTLSEALSWQQDKSNLSSAKAPIQLPKEILSGITKLGSSFTELKEILSKGVHKLSAKQTISEDHPFTQQMNSVTKNILELKTILESRLAQLSAAGQHGQETDTQKVSSEMIDLSEMAITRETLNKIYQLIDSDEKVIGKKHKSKARENINLPKKKT